VWENGKSGLGKEKIRNKQKYPVVRVAGSGPPGSMPEKALCPPLSNLAPRFLVAYENLRPFTLTSDALIFCNPILGACGLGSKL